MPRTGAVGCGAGDYVEVIAASRKSEDVPDPDRLALMSMMASLAPLPLTAGATLLALVNAIADADE